MNLEILSILAFFGIIGAIIIIDRKNIEFGLILIRRTKKGEKKIKEFALKHKRFFNVFAVFSVIVGVLLSIVGFVYLFSGTGVRLILPKVFPGEVSEGVQEVVFFMPLWYWVIGLFIIIIPHELFHGFLFALEKIKIKSVGFFLFLIFPGGFVEPDEEQFSNSKPFKRMKISAVGSIANACTYIILILLTLLWLYIGSLVFQEVGISFEGTIPDTPANEVGMEGVITEINGKEVKNFENLSNIFEDISPGDTVNVVTTKGEYSFRTIESPENPSQAFMGIENLSTKLDYKPRFTFLGNPSGLITVYTWIADLLSWLGVITISVAIANLLPFLPFDGGILWKSIFEKVTKNENLSKKMILGLTIITYSLLIMSFVDVRSILGTLGLI